MAKFKNYSCFCFVFLTGKLIDEEKKAVGIVSSHVYKTYWKSFGNAMAIWIITFFVFVQGKYLLFHY